MTIALLGILFAILVIVGMPVSFAIGVAAMFGTLVLPDVDNATIVQRMLTAINTFPLLAVIFFIFAGQLMGEGAVGSRLVRFAGVLVGGLPGALAHIVIVSSMFFGGVTGSAVAEVSSIGSIMIPAMERDGYPRRFATAIVLTSARMGPIIPPSIGMIVFAHVAGNVSIAALFLAGIVPGILIGLSLMVAAFIHGRLYHKKSAPQLTGREKVHRLFDGIAGLMTIVIILARIHLGLVVIVNLSFGLITPPVGTALFVGVKIAGISMDKVIPPMLPLLACMIAVLLFVTYFPEVFMWIPRGAGFAK